MQFTHPATQLAGVPRADIEDLPVDVRAVILGACTSAGSSHSGAENGPYFLRTLSKAYTWSASRPAITEVTSGRTITDGIVDIGDLRLGVDVPIEESLAHLRLAVEKLPLDVVPCTIGGDHSVTLPIVQALASRRTRPFRVVQFDHHLDLQLWDGAPGDPTVGREKIFNTNVMSHISDILGPGRIVQVGVDPFATVEATCAGDVGDFLRRLGIQLPLTSPALLDDDRFDRELGGDDDVYVTVDVDVLTEHDMSSTGYPAPLGLGIRELLHLLDLVARRHRLIGFDIVEFAAPRGARDRKTLGDAGRALTILLHILSLVGCQTAQLGRTRAFVQTNSPRMLT